MLIRVQKTAFWTILGSKMVEKWSKMVENRRLEAVFGRLLTKIVKMANLLYRLQAEICRGFWRFLAKITILDQNRRFWTKIDHFGRKSTILDRFGPFWTSNRPKRSILDLKSWIRGPTWPALASGCSNSASDAGDHAGHDFGPKSGIWTIWTI